MALYKYLIPDRIDILDRELVRFTHPRALNDLTELRPAFSSLLTKEYLLKNLDLERIASEACKDLPESARQESRQFALEKLTSEEGRRMAEIGLSMLNSFAPKLRSEISRSFDQLIGVLSLSEAWDNGPMWAHYADQHRGFVLGLDDSSGYFSRRRTQKNEFYHLRKVAYEAPSPGPRSFEDLSNGKNVFLTKDISWSYEREWRMLAPLPDAAVVLGSPDDPVHLFPLPGTVIESIIIGTRASQEFKTMLASMINGRSSLAHIKLFQAQIDDDRGGLRLHPLQSET